MKSLQISVLSKVLTIFTGKKVDILKYAQVSDQKCVIAIDDKRVYINDKLIEELVGQEPINDYILNRMLFRLEDNCPDWRVHGVLTIAAEENNTVGAVFKTQNGPEVLYYNSGYDMFLKFKNEDVDKYDIQWNIKNVYPIKISNSKKLTETKVEIVKSLLNLNIEKEVNLDDVKTTLFVLPHIYDCIIKSNYVVIGSNQNASITFHNEGMTKRVNEAVKFDKGSYAFNTLDVLKTLGVTNKAFTKVKEVDTILVKSIDGVIYVTLQDEVQGVEDIYVYVDSLGLTPLKYITTTINGSSAGSENGNSLIKILDNIKKQLTLGTITECEAKYLLAHYAK